jgi:hypothetical protein
MVDELTKLKKEQDGDIVVHGGALLVQGASRSRSTRVTDQRMTTEPVGAHHK